MNLHILIRNSWPYNIYCLCKEGLFWIKKRYEAPSPRFIKTAVLLRNSIPNAVWVETGTYLGQTTKVLSKHGSFVYSIEPQPQLYENAAGHFKAHKNVQIIKGLSENIFPSLLPSLSGNVNFWLDGHFSAGITHKGPNETPILIELACISKNRVRFNNICIMIDDVRSFKSVEGNNSGYPPIGEIVKWAESNQLIWNIEQDIFVIKSK